MQDEARIGRERQDRLVFAIPGKDAHGIREQKSFGIEISADAQKSARLRQLGMRK